MRSIRLAVAAAVLLCGVLGSGGIALGDTYLQGVGTDHDREFKHDRFYTEANPPKAFHAEAYNFSGVGKSSDGKWVTMISPKYFVSATHWHPSTDGTKTVTFYEGNTTSSGGHTYTVASSGVQIDGSDLWLGKLTGDIPSADNITYYPVLDLDPESDYLDRLIYTYGKGKLEDHRVGLNNIDWIGARTVGASTGRVMDFDFDAVGGAGESEAYLMSGDSGGPSFTIWDGALALLGVHWYNTGIDPPNAGDFSGDTFIPYYIDQLNTNMESGHSVTTVPEPCAVLLLSLGAMGMILRRRR